MTLYAVHVLLKINISIFIEMIGYLYMIMQFLLKFDIFNTLLQDKNDWNHPLTKRLFTHTIET